MAWGNIHAFHRDESLPDVDSHVWEYLRLSVGFDAVIGDYFAIGPWGRVGLANQSFATFVLGVRVSTAFP